MYPMSISSLGSSYVYINRDQGRHFWYDGFNNYLCNITFKIRISFSLVSSFILSSKNLEYGDEEHHEWLQQWNFKKRSRE
mmetsp:Transcript_20069/g.22599  ORF Transcript_20069/g.22599 Transcript_20069/m.22599 type:complete len:80 (-) Transcript_20069:38-277(-)